MSRVVARRFLAAVIVALVSADWGTKLWIANRLELGETEQLVDGWLYFIHRHNPGVAFSMFADLPDAVRIPMLSVLSLIGIGLFARVVLQSEDGWTQLAAATVIAGAVGNLGERVLNGRVTDFVFFPFFPFVFNFADAAITVGGALLATRLFIEGPEKVGPAGPAVPPATS